MSPYMPAYWDLYIRSPVRSFDFSAPPPDNFTQILNLLREDAYKSLDNV